MATQTEQPKPKTAIVVSPETSVWARVAKRHGMDYEKCRETIINTLMPRKEGRLIATETDMAAALLIADRYGLDPFAKEIYFTPARGGGILSIVGIDGWVKIANEEKDYRGWSYADIEDEKGNLIACEVTIHFRNDREPARVREWLKECTRPTDPWRQMPRRLLRVRALCQAIRLSFGVGGIMLPDEAEGAGMIDHSRAGEGAKPTNGAPAPLVQRVAARATEIAGETTGRIVDVESSPATEERSGGFTPEENAALDQQLVDEENARSGKE